VPEYVKKKNYLHFVIKPSESLDEFFFAPFHKILSNLRVVNVIFTYAKNARQLQGALDMS
jgi:hypothetical protein